MPIYEYAYVLFNSTYVVIKVWTEWTTKYKMEGDFGTVYNKDNTILRFKLIRTECV